MTFSKNDVQFRITEVYSDLSKCKRDLKDSHITKNEAIASIEVILRDLSIINEMVGKMNE